MMNIAFFVLFVLLLLLLAAYIWLWKRHRKGIGKVRFLFHALDNGDYSFHFPEQKGDGEEQKLNTLLNRVKTILQHARDDQMEKEKYFELILNSVDTGIIVVEEARGIVLRSNRAACELLKVDVVTHINQIKQQLETLSTRETHTILKGKRVRIIGFSDIKGELTNQEIDSWIKLTRVLTHEIMNTVTPIISLSDTLLRQSQGEQREGLQVINQTGKELIHFVENYRRFALLPKPEPKPFYVLAFLERMERLAVPLLKPRSTVTLAVEPRDLLVYADEALISRVVSNILKNAAEAVGEGGHIMIKAYQNVQEAVIIDVTNDGPLIPPDLAAHIFVPFFTTKQQGSGIGLSISRQIMRVSNGSVELITDEKARLTTFRLTFN